MKDDEIIGQYLSGEEFRCRAGEDNQVEGGDCLDESLLVSPILADYLGRPSYVTERSTAKKKKKKKKSRSSSSLCSTDVKTPNRKTPSRVKPNQDVLLDTSYCPSLGLGSTSCDDEISMESRITKPTYTIEEESSYMKDGDNSDISMRATSDYKNTSSSGQSKKVSNSQYGESTLAHKEERRGTLKTTAKTLFDDVSIDEECVEGKKENKRKDGSPYEESQNNQYVSNHNSPPINRQGDHIYPNFEDQLELSVSGIESCDSIITNSSDATNLRTQEKNNMESPVKDVSCEKSFADDIELSDVETCDSGKEGTAVEVKTPRDTGKLFANEIELSDVETCESSNEGTAVEVETPKNKGNQIVFTTAEDILLKDDRCKDKESIGECLKSDIERKSNLCTALDDALNEIKEFKFNPDYEESYEKYETIKATNGNTVLNQDGKNHSASQENEYFSETSPTKSEDMAYDTIENRSKDSLNSNFDRTASILKAAAPKYENSSEKVLFKSISSSKNIHYDSKNKFTHEERVSKLNDVYESHQIETKVAYTYTNDVSEPKLLKIDKENQPPSSINERDKFMNLPNETTASGIFTDKHLKVERSTIHRARSDMIGRSTLGEISNTKRRIKPKSSSEKKRNVKANGKPFVSKCEQKTAPLVQRSKIYDFIEKSKVETYTAASVDIHVAKGSAASESADNSKTNVNLENSNDFNERNAGDSSEKTLKPLTANYNVELIDSLEKPLTSEIKRRKKLLSDLKTEVTSNDPLASSHLCLTDSNKNSVSPYAESMSLKLYGMKSPLKKNYELVMNSPTQTQSQSPLRTPSPYAKGMQSKLLELQKSSDGHREIGRDNHCLNSPRQILSNSGQKVKSPFEKILDERQTTKAESCPSDDLAITSPREDLSSARKKISASSGALIEALQGAARRRKLQVTRARESIAAKEQFQKEIKKEMSEQKLKPQKLEGKGQKPEEKSTLRCRRKTVGSTSTVRIPTETSRPISQQIHKKEEKKITNIHKAKYACKINPAASNTTKPGAPLIGTKSKTSMPPPIHYKRTFDCSKNLPPEENPYKPFKALPLPFTTVSGGSAGVPKVVKPPPTVPSSPRLGLKCNGVHSSGKKLSSYTEPLRKIKKDVVKPPMKKLPVAKKSALNAKPFRRIAAGSEASKEKERLLREKLEREKAENRRKSSFRARPMPSFSTDVEKSSPPLLGIEFLNEKSEPHSSPEAFRVDSPITFEESMVESPTTKNRASYSSPTLHTISRAKKRAEFEEKRRTREQLKQVERNRNRKSIIREKSKELIALRKSLK